MTHNADKELLKQAEMVLEALTYISEPKYQLVGYLKNLAIESLPAAQSLVDALREQQAEDRQIRDALKHGIEHWKYGYGMPISKGIIGDSILNQMEEALTILNKRLGDI